MLLVSKIFSHSTHTIFSAPPRLFANIVATILFLLILGYKNLLLSFLLAWRCPGKRSFLFLGTWFHLVCLPRIWMNLLLCLIFLFFGPSCSSNFICAFMLEMKECVSCNLCIVNSGLLRLGNFLYVDLLFYYFLSLDFSCCIASNDKQACHERKI